MPLCFLDASAWSKRYTGESGWDVLDELFALAGADRHCLLVSTTIGYAEVVAVIVRLRNRTSLTNEEMDGLLRRIQADASALIWMNVPSDAFEQCLSLIERYSLNATDAALLYSLLRFQRRLQQMQVPLWLVASDRRLLHAAAAEGIACLDPEVSSPREVRGLLS